MLRLFQGSLHLPGAERHGAAVTAKMLHEGHVFHEIVEETGASTATISRVNRAIKDGCDGYQIIFDRTEKTEEK